MHWATCDVLLVLPLVRLSRGSVTTIPSSTDQQVRTRDGDYTGVAWSE